MKKYLYITIVLVSIAVIGLFIYSKSLQNQIKKKEKYKAEYITKSKDYAAGILLVRISTYFINKPNYPYKKQYTDVLTFYLTKLGFEVNENLLHDTLIYKKIPFDINREYWWQELEIIMQNNIPYTKKYLDTIRNLSLDKYEIPQISKIIVNYIYNTDYFKAWKLNSKEKTNLLKFIYTQLNNNKK